MTLDLIGSGAAAATGGDAGAGSGGASGAGDAGSSGQMGGAVTIPTGGASSQASTPDFMSFVPADYKEEHWVKDAARADDPFKAFFESAKNAQSLIGKKTGIEIPAADAAPDVVKAFHKALGVPETPDKYEYTPPDISGEPENVRNFLTELAKDDSLMKAMKPVGHELGLTPTQFAGLATALDMWKVQDAKNTLAAAEAAGVEREAKFKEFYGDKTDYVQRIAKETFAKVIPEHIRKTGDPDLIVFEAMRHIYEGKYKPDTITTAGSAGSTASSYDEIQSEINRLRAKPEYKNFQSNEYSALHKQVDELYIQQAEIERRG